MTGAGVMIIYVLMIVLGIAALVRGKDVFRLGLTRGTEQLFKLLPRMFFALVAAGFIAILIPTELIGRFLGEAAGFKAIVIGSLTGMIVPAGPAISFSIAAVLATEGASTPALVSFITSWSVFALHRVFIFEIPLLGFSFTRLRMLSGLILPLIAGGLTLGAMRLLAAS